MSLTITLAYERVGDTLLSSGSITSNENGLVTTEGGFANVEFRKMMQTLVKTLANWPPEQELDIVLQRVDHEGLVPYKLDAATVKLLRTDPTAAIASMTYPTQSPSTIVKRVKKDVPMVEPPLKAGNDALADTFGDVVYLKVREHELECPGCGFWGMYISPGLLRAQERIGSIVKTTFVCPKKCRERFVVTVDGTWGYVDVSYLLERTKLDAFYLPRAWNEGRPWVSRETLKKLYDQYNRDKEQV